MIANEMGAQDCMVNSYLRECARASASAHTFAIICAVSHSHIRTDTSSVENKKLCEREKKANELK